MKHYLFEDWVSGEEFIVGAYTLEEAEAIASENFADPVFHCILSEWEAENSGLDEY